jgi:hypothetical protein
MPALRLAAGTEVRSIHGGLATGVVAGTGAYAYLVESPVQYVRAVGGLAIQEWNMPSGVALYPMFSPQ